MLTTPVLCAEISLYIWLESSVPDPVLGPGGDPDPGPVPELERTGTEEGVGLVFLLTGGQLYIRIVPLAVPECTYSDYTYVRLHDIIIAVDFCLLVENI